MITTFEEYTFDLTPEEEAILPVFLDEVRWSADPVKGPELVSRINDRLEATKLKFRMTDERFRKFVNYVRSHGIVPLIATSRGYFVSHDPDQIRIQMKSLRERAGGILAARAGLSRFLPPNT